MNESIAEYLGSVNSSGNGNGHANGNGKAFILAQPKSPEEIQREAILKMVPELRRNCSRDPRLKNCVGAKWLYGQLTDLSFMHTFGGNGFGVVHLSIKDLVRIYGHDAESFEHWRDRLVATGWIWFFKTWPKSQWGISGICKQPELFGPAFSSSEVDYIRTMAKAAKPKEPALSPGGVKTEHSGPNGRADPIAKPKEPDSKAGASGPQSRNFRPLEPEEPAGKGGQNPESHPEDPALLPGGTGFVMGKVSDLPSDQPPQLRSTPMEPRSSGANKCVAPAPKPTHTGPEFEPLDRKVVQRLRPKLGEQMIDRFKEKIFALENSRSPMPNRADLVAAYKQRIKAVKNWMAGEL